jgi:GSH-dependent disulfide-bond oxidoreductase
MESWMSDLSAFPIAKRWPAQYPDRLQLYSLPTPNGVKVSIALEEIGLPYEPHMIDIGKNESWTPEFLSLNPNGKIPAIIDPNGPGGKPIGLFESGAILLYLAEKTGKFLPPNNPKARGELLSWLMFVASGVGPFAGQSVHFRNYAPEKIEYATNRYVYEATRHFNILDARLAKRKYMLGDTYTIVDMAVWGWARLMPTVLGEAAWAKFPNLKRMVDEISAHPAATRAIAIKDKHKFKTEFDDEAKKAMFGHLSEKVA